MSDTSCTVRTDGTLNTATNYIQCPGDMSGVAYIYMYHTCLSRMNISKVTLYHVHCLSSYQDDFHYQQGSPLERLQPNILREDVHLTVRDQDKYMFLAPYPVAISCLSDYPETGLHVTRFSI